MNLINQPSHGIYKSYLMTEINLEQHLILTFKSKENKEIQMKVRFAFFKQNGKMLIPKEFYIGHIYCNKQNNS